RTRPVVSLTAPASGATVSGTVNVTASASDNVGVAAVDFYVDSALKFTATTSPYSFPWNTTGYTNSSHTVSATARDAAGNAGTSSTVNVTVNNPAPAPVGALTVNITYPLGGTFSRGANITIYATATNAIGVKFYVDGSYQVGP